LSELEAIQPVLDDEALRRAGLQYFLYRRKVQTALFRKDLGFVCRQHVEVTTCTISFVAAPLPSSPMQKISAADAAKTSRQRSSN